ncbi:aspartate kinase [Halenospora varia]|nr:aspartate kinase [Halenospora varia]
MPLILPQTEKPWIVQKYGGTSLGKLLEAITGTIIPQYLDNNNVAVVCSAISGSTKSEGTTSLLLKAVELATSRDGTGREVNEVIDLVRDNHLSICKDMQFGIDVVRNAKVFAELEKGIRSDCEGVRSFLVAAQTIGELSGRAKDKIVATGERLACRVVVASLLSKGINAKLATLDDLVESVYTEDMYKQKLAYEELGPRFFDALAVDIGRRIEECGDAVPVVTGFFGMMPIPLLESVGRGYSDLCAAMCAVGTEASELQIWKEVDGIFTADPRKVPSARLLPTITLEEASELTYYGSEVIHPLTMGQIRNANVPLRIKNVKNPEGSGTIIYPSPSPSNTPKTSSSTSSLTSLNSSDSIASFMQANGYYGSSQSRRAPTALTAKDSIVLMNVQSNRQKKSHGFLAQVFAKLDELDVVADLITSSEQSVSLAISSLDGLAKIERLMQSLEKCGKVEVLQNMVIVSVIGHKMRNMVGIAGQIFSKLASGGVNIYLIGQGASEINVSLVVKNDDAQIAMDIIHEHVLGIPKYDSHAPIYQNGLMKGPWLY